jgi:hypothetical protein
VPPDPRPIPRFIADSTREGIPSGRFAERLAGEFRSACDALDDLPERIKADGELEWFPSRGWGGRVWVPVSTRAEGPEGQLELFGHVSYVQPEEGDPTELRAKADFTDVLAEDNEDWKIDLNDDVIGRWHGERNRGGGVTLVWGRPLLPGAVAATAELDGVTVDQEEVTDGRFTIVGLDAVDVEGFGDRLYMQLRLWSKRAQELAAESLYD